MTKNQNITQKSSHFKSSRVYIVYGIIRYSTIKIVIYPILFLPYTQVYYHLGLIQMKY